MKIKKLLSVLLVLCVVLAWVPVTAGAEETQTVVVGDIIRVTLEHMEKQEYRIIPEESGEYIFYLSGGTYMVDAETGEMYPIDICSLYVVDENGAKIGEEFRNQATQGLYCNLEAGKEYTLQAVNDQTYETAIRTSIYYIKSEPATSITIDGVFYDTSNPGDWIYVYAVTTPEVPSERTLTWESSDESVAIVTPYKLSCHVECVGVGTATITARTESGVSASFIVEVIEAGEVDYTCGDNLTWSYDETTRTLTISGTGDMYDGYSNLSFNSMEWRFWAERIVIEEGVTSIGQGAFADFNNVKEFQIPNSLTQIGGYSFPFRATGLTDLYISSNVETIGDYAFRGVGAVWVDEGNLNYCSDDDGALYNKEKTKLMHVPCNIAGGFIVPDTVIDVNSCAFSFCQELTDIYFGANVSYIDQNAFDYCNNLVGFWVDGNNPYYTNDEYGVLYNKDMTELVRAPFGITGIYNIPSTVTRIWWDAFYCCTKISEIILPEGITKIESQTFRYCEALERITIPASVTEIDFWAFMGCNYLGSITFNGDAPTIIDAFYGVRAIVYYPNGNETWTEEAMQSFESEWDDYGQLTWVAYDPCENGHTYESVVADPTCTEQGYTTHTCTICGDTYLDTYVDATGHSYGEWYTVTEATCTVYGEERRDCANCDHYETHTTELADHTYESVVTEPTCTEQGYTTHTCAACGDSYVDGYVDALGHNYESVVTPPTYVEQGYTTHTCTVCGHSYVDNYVEALIHYDVLEGDCTEWSEESEVPLAIRADADIAKFVEVRLNSKVVDPENYTVTEGSTIVTLKPEYLATLPSGEYSMEIVFTDGVAEATFHITGSAVVLGDLNGDGEVDIFDANLIVAYYNGTADLDADQQRAADVNGDGEIDIFDANLVVSYYNGTIAAFPAEE